jgi:hypothetical protein
MGFFDPETENRTGPVAIPQGMDITPKPRATTLGEEWGAAWRTENPIGSVMNSFAYNPAEPIDPEYSPYAEIEGTHYQDYWERFAGARTPSDAAAMKAQIDRENEDRQTLAAAGARGFFLSMGASLLSPSTLLPGGVIVKGAKGVRIGLSGLSAATAAGSAVAFDEAVLQASQQTRTGQESALAIGGSMILGGILGAGASYLTRQEFRAASKQTENVLVGQHDFVEGLRSMGAAENARDFTLKREGIFKMVREIPILGRLMKTSPLLRTVLSDLDETRKASAQLVESPYQYKINDEGQSVLAGDVSVETRIKEREYNDLSNAYGALSRQFAEYWADGPVGFVGQHISQPVSRAYSYLLRRTEKLSEAEFMEEVGKAMRRNDEHPIPQVAAAARHLRENIFNRIKDDAAELGIFGKDMEVKFADSYFSRVYNVGKIAKHLGDGTADDMEEMLAREFTKERKLLGEAIEGPEIRQAARDTIRSILGMKPGEHPYRAGVGDPRKARVLSLSDEVLEPWLENDASVIMGHYFRGLVPDIEITRTFGDLDMTVAKDAIHNEASRRMAAAKSEKERARILKEAEADVADLEAMRDRIRGVYGVPDHPDSFIVQASRASRNLSFMGHLGGMTVAAIPDIAGVVGRGGVKAAFGASIDLVTNPKRLFKTVADMKDFGAAAEWYLSSRAASLADVFDPYARRTKLDRAGSWAAGKFAKATGMIHWNMGWKMIGSAVISTRMAKAADAVVAGTATKKQLAQLAENGIEPWMAARIAKQFEKYADKNGQIWMPNAGQWTDQEAFHAFRRAMTREQDIMVITPGQDIPLSFSKEAGRFFLQFKRFGFSAYERILLAGIQRTDADVLAQFTMAVLLGGLVANIRAAQTGNEPKTGAAWWEDAIDRSGLSGWLMEPYNAMSALSGGRLSISGEPVSRFQSRSVTAGMLGPSIDMATGVVEAVNAFSTGKASYKDVRKLMRPIPGNNLFYLMGLFRKVEEAMVKASGAKPRSAE